MGVESAKTIYTIVCKNQKIKQINLNWNKLGDEGIKIIAKILYIPTNIISLWIGSNGLSNTGWETILNPLFKNNTLVSLKIFNKERVNRNKINSSGLQKLSQLMQVSQTLTFIDLSLMSLGDWGVNSILKGISGTINDEGNEDLEEDEVKSQYNVKILQEVKSDFLINKYLSSMVLVNNELTINWMNSIIGIILNSSLEHLNLSFNKLGDKSIGKLAPCIGSSRWSLKILELENWQISGIGILPLLSSLKNNGKIFSLSLDRNDLSGPAVIKFKEMLHSNKGISKLSLSKWNLGDYGARAIAQGYYRNNQLTHINLWDNDIGDKGAESFILHLETINPAHAPLKCLNLSNNIINDIYAMKLSKILNAADRPVCHLSKHLILIFSPG